MWSSEKSIGFHQVNNPREYYRADVGKKVKKTWVQIAAYQPAKQL
jgi:hypothetical protein